jgi:hypothetical protein
MTDELDRLFEILVESLHREARLAVPFPANELHERLVPYRSSRSRLRVATYEDYEMAVLRLLAGERDYLRLEPDTARAQLQAEVTSVNPDTGFFRNFGDAQVLVNRIAAERHLRGREAYAPPPEAGAEAVLPEPEPGPPPPSHPGPAAPTGSGAPAPAPARPPDPAFELVESRDQLEVDHCAYCGGPLPAGREVNFCPHCGQPASGEPKCPACGSAVDVGWSYCVGCGRATGFE